MKKDSQKEFAYRVNMDLKLLVRIVAENKEAADVVIEEMSPEEMLKHEINDISTIQIKQWNQ